MTKALVAYFSASHGKVTEAVAKKLAAATDADLFAIEPETLYSPADLNWNNANSRSTKESNDPNSRPTLKNPVPDLSAYNTVYVGFPIWWYREPRIIDTFLEAGHFAGKTIIPFATSSSSQMGNTSELMQKIVPAANVKQGTRFPASVTEEELGNWAAQQ